MSASPDRVKNNISENIPTWSSDYTTNVKNKSILSSPEYKRGSSKATIQWEESVKEQRLEERMKLEKRNRLHALGHLMCHGSKWGYIQEYVTKLKAEDGRIFKTGITEEDSQGWTSPRRIDSLVRELRYGMLQKIVMKGEDLTLDQQTKLELMKHKIKYENNKYLKRHPELNILLSLVYRKLLRTKPDDPNMFVANYVHYLNSHREELVLDEVSVPFDIAAEEVKKPVEEIIDERQVVEVFIRELVQKCAEIASCGSAVSNVVNIIDSILKNIDPPKDEVINMKIASSSLKSAESAVRGILMSMLTSVARARTKSSEIIVEEVLDSVFESVCPSVRRDSEELIEVRESVESFVKYLLKSVTDKAARQIKRQERLRKFERTISGEDSSLNEDQDVLSITSKSILKKLNTPRSEGENSSHKHTEKLEFKTKVTFQSMSLSGTPSNDSTFKENLQD